MHEFKRIMYKKANLLRILKMLLSFIKYHFFNLKYNCFVYKLRKGSQREGTIPTKPRSRSVPDVVVLNSQPLTGLLIKYQRLPRDFFWNSFLLSASFLFRLVYKK